MSKNPIRLTLIGLALCAPVGTANALPALTTPLAQPVGVTIIKSEVDVNSILFQKIFKAPSSILPLRKPIAQKLSILHSTRTTGGGGTGVGGGGQGGTVSSTSAILSPNNMQVTNAFGSDDVITLTADNVYVVQPSSFILPNDPALNLSSTLFDNNGPFAAVGIAAGDLGPSTMFEVDFTVQTIQSVNANYLLQMGNFSTGNIESMTASTNPNDYYISGAQTQATQDVYTFVQGNYSVVAIQCPVYFTLYSCEVTPVSQ